MMFLPPYVAGAAIALSVYAEVPWLIAMNVAIFVVVCIQLSVWLRA